MKLYFTNLQRKTMDGIIALGHFCETHGPCIILSTQKFETPPTQRLHDIISCEACESIPADQVFISRDENVNYVSSRAPFQPHDAFLMKQAAIRALSCEHETTHYFGDNERGHVCSYSFIIHDSLARGFQRKYVMLALMQDKINLLNSWKLIMEVFQSLTNELTALSLAVNESEQKQKFQRALRQLQSNPVCISRSLSQLTKKPTIYAHLHYCFTWLLGCPSIVEQPYYNDRISIAKPSSFLRCLYQQLGDDNFNKLLAAYFAGCRIECSDSEVLTTLNSIWPANVEFKGNNEKNCDKISISDDGEFFFEIKSKLVECQMQKSVVEALKNSQLSEKTLEIHIGTIVMNWIHISNILQWCPNIDLALLKNLNIKSSDVPLLNNLVANKNVINNLTNLINSESKKGN